MSKFPQNENESRLIELLIEHDQNVHGEDSVDTPKFDDSQFSSGQHRIQLEKAKACLEKLQRFARRNEFPGESRKGASFGTRSGESDSIHLFADRVDTPNDGSPNNSTVEQVADGEPFETQIADEEQFNGTRAAESQKRLSLVPDYIGRFRILKQLGIGGFGIVFHAYDPELDREVALKILRPESLLTEANRIRFERESKLAAMLNHPAIVPVHETGIDGPIRFIVFGYVQGETLADWLKRFGRPLKAQQAAAILVRIADGVSCAHQHGILHRDLKPGNLLVEADGKHETVDAEQLANQIHVADFGLAVNVDCQSSLTHSGTMLGTPVYIAPELISGKQRPSMSSDVYSLGVILFELLSGEQPYQSDSGLQLLRNIIENSPPRINSVLTRNKKEKSSTLPIDRDLEAVCFKCLLKAPSQRYQNAGELLLDLQRWQSGEPVLARQVTVWSRAVRWAVRKPIFAGLTLAIVSLVLLLAIGGTWAAVELASRNAELKNSWFDALVVQSESAQDSTKAGRRKQSLQAIRSAVELLPNDKDDAKRQLLRNQAIANMTIFDLAITNTIELPSRVTRQASEIAFDSNIERVAFPNDKNEIVVLNCVSGEVESRIAVGNMEVYQLIFIPNTNKLSAVLSTSGATGKLVVWGIGKNEPEIFASFDSVDPSFQIASSNDGATVVALNESCTLQFFDVKTGTVRKSEDSLATRPAGASFSPSDSMLAVWTGNRIDVRAIKSEPDQFDLNGKPAHSFEHRFNPELIINSVSWSPDEEQLASATSVFSTHVWSTTWGESQHHELAGHTGWAIHSLFDPNNQFVASASSDGTTRLWNPETAELLLVASGQAMAISPDGNRIGGIKDSQIVVWDVLAPQCQNKWEACGDKLAALNGVSSPNGRYLAYLNAQWMFIRDLDNDVELWQVETIDGLDVAYSGDGQFAFLAEVDRLIRVEVATLKEIVFYDGREFDDECGIVSGTLSVSHDGSLAAIETCDDITRIFSQSGLGCEFSGSDTTGDLLFHPTLPQFIVSTDNGFEFRELQPDSSIQNIRNIEYADIAEWDDDFVSASLQTSESAFPIKFNSDGRFLAIQSDQYPSILDLKNLCLYPIENVEGKLDNYDFAFSPDGSLLAVSGIDQSIFLYQINLDSDKPFSKIAQFPVGTSGTWVAFSSDSTRIISANADQRIYEWDLTSIRSELKRLKLDWNER